ncbi:MAG: Signal transduction histidine-protein kinase/phosphatase DegS [bacterium ADurb.Bin270]|nr:MAG: Signal transduction histidine-protein kinase/phosphatase DegS [bacterium ADurb.Bin270]
MGKHFKTIAAISAIVILTLACYAIHKNYSLLFVILIALMGGAGYQIRRMNIRFEALNSELNQIFNKSTNGMLIVDEDHNILQANYAMLKMTGYEPSGASLSRIVGKKCYDIYPNINCNSSSCPCKRIFDGEQFFERDLTISLKDGSQVHCIVAASPFRKDGDRAMSVMLDYKDITERKENEKKFARYRTQLQTMASELSLTEERERRRLATNLHDSVSQNLFITKMKVGALRKCETLVNKDEALSEIYGNIDKALSETRTLIFEISPPILYELGLDSALEWLCDTAGKKHEIKFSYSSDMQDRKVDIDVAILIFQTARELINNVIKHSGATEVQVMLRAGKEYLRCVVEDNGSGFDVSTAQQDLGGNAGFGLFNIKERLSYFEGNLLLESEIGKGTKATVIAPFKSYAREYSEEKNNEN